ncbi:uncharacterized protein DC041_0010818 [Schistosoma bovis]|uniref:Uncharacterized protein n=1 Tax=Schistosoma bovis TaxID=6184 RepID=A0A430Q2S9_SCHBO|nr:uncharacterized protein DC041_0010818 [Schistosoma bovis]
MDSFNEEMSSTNSSTNNKGCLEEVLFFLISFTPTGLCQETVPQNNDNAVISLAENFNNSTHYYHPPRLQSLPNNNNDNNDNYSVSYGENGQCVLRDLTIHSNLTDKHQFVVLSPTSLSSAFEIPNGNANQTLPMTDNTKLNALYLILCKL